MSFERRAASLSSAFGVWITQLAPMLLQPSAQSLPSLDFMVDRESNRTARIVRRSSEKVTIELYARFVDELEKETADHADLLHAACLGDVDLREMADAAKQALVDCVTDLASTFVLLHEMFHFLCGHFDAARGGSRAEFAFDETELHYSPPTSDAAGSLPEQQATADIDEAWLRAYYLEFEADASALQWLMQMSSHSTIAKLVALVTNSPEDPEEGTLYALEEGQRIVAHRALVAAVWLVIRMLERRRLDPRQRLSGHPLPSARLLAALFTVLQQYAELDSTELNESGFFSQRLSEDKEVSDLREFLRRVLAPVLKVDWPSRGDPVEHESFRTASVWVARELGQIMQGEPPATVAGRELVRVQATRPAMTAWLERHRQLPFELAAAET